MMKLGAGILALVILAAVSPAFAEEWGDGIDSQTVALDRVGRWDWGVLGGGAFNGDFGDAGYIQTQLAYGLTPWIAVGAEAGYQENDGGDFNDENIGVVPVMADVIVRVPTLNKRVVPYGVAGIGAIGAWVKDEDGDAPDNNGDDVDDTTFGWKIGAGADWFFHPNYIAYIEAAYFQGYNDLEGSSVDDVGFGMFGAGIKYVNY